MLKNDASEFGDTLKPERAFLEAQLYKTTLLPKLRSPWVRAAQLPDGKRAKIRLKPVPEEKEMVRSALSQL